MKVQELGIITVGARQYWLQRHSTRTQQVYVFRKGKLEQRGLVFKNLDAVFDWVERSGSRQLSLF